MGNKSFKQLLLYAAGTAVGLSFMLIAVAFALCIFGAVNIGKSYFELYTTQIYTKYTAIALACFIVPVLASCAFAAFSNNKKFKAVSAALCFALTVLCIIFFNVIAAKAVNSASYSAVYDYLILLFVLAAASAVLAFFFTVSAVFAYKKYTVKEADFGGGE